MKKKRFIATLFGLLILAIFSGCQDEEDLSVKDKTYSENAPLQRILLYARADDKNPISIVSEYEYDASGKITKVTSPIYIDGVIKGTSNYDLYEYDAMNRLVKIMSYNANLNAGFLNLKNTIYSYGSDGLKEKEQLEFPQIGSFEYIRYINQDGRLVEKEHYNGLDKLEMYTELAYNQAGELIEENFYSGDNELFRVIKHSYTNGLQTKSDTFQGLEMEQLREVKRTFDANRNLILLESNELSILSSAHSHVLRYEYVE
ncbi:MAG TPA: hypothetical protein VK957_09125 [Lunatimonas sp.]|nr:hypothetical protein [Lunatimonas sp.]